MQLRRKVAAVHVHHTWRHRRQDLRGLATVAATRKFHMDMWCEGGDPPPAAPAPELRLSHDDTYTPTGHLSLHIKHTRGC